MEFNMLILSRRASEKLRIGDDIAITICRVKDGQIRLGIEAPTNVVVLRDNAVKQIPKSKNKLRVDVP